MQKGEEELAEIHQQITNIDPISSTCSICNKKKVVKIESVEFIICGFCKKDKQIEKERQEE